MATIRVDRDLCLEAGQCAHVLPDLFILDDAGPVQLAGERPAGPVTLVAENLEPARRAAAMCPSAAITVNE
ncbi:ferredoxin [Mycobacteroides abscessus subsp. abscessus]|nr:ferredoxin [Mycobacteroides abscessus subsp. abscessus]